MNKGQMEIIGLVIIVTLLAVGMLFMAKFALVDKEGKKIFLRKEMATSTMTSLMEMNIPKEKCGTTDNLQLQGDILEDCLEYATIECDYKGEPLMSCEFFDRIVTDLLDETLVKWGKKYEMVILMAGEEESRKHLGEGNCPRERDTSQPYAIRTNVGLATSYLYICE